MARACNGQQRKSHIAKGAEERVGLLWLMNIDGNILGHELVNHSWSNKRVGVKSIYATILTGIVK